MRYSIEPRDRICVKGYEFLSFAKIIGAHATKVAKTLSNGYSKKLFDTATHATKVASKRAIQKITETTDDLIGK